MEFSLKMELIDINKFSELHDNENIFFTKTEFLQDDFSYIKTLKNNVVLISGNSDYPINSSRMINLPDNVVKWFAQNAIENHPRLEPLPIGLENKVICKRLNHGVNYYDSAKLKEDFIFTNHDIIPTKKIYSNFNINTNLFYRNKIKTLCIQAKHIVWEEPKLSINNFMSKVLEYESVVCPIGNGVDTHRLWEVLYLKRIPITIKVGNFKLYELYKELPIVVLENEFDLLNEELLLNKIEQIKETKYNMDLIDFNFWKNKIYKTLKK